MKKLRVLKDIEIFFENDDDLGSSTMTLKKDLIINVQDEELEVLENIPGVKYDKCYFITFDAWKYDRELIDIKMINQTPESSYTEDFLRHEEAGIFIPTSDVEVIFEQSDKEKELLEKLHNKYENSDDIEDEFKGMTSEEFEEYEREQYSIDIFYNRNMKTFEEYLQWAYDNFGNWG